MDLVEMQPIEHQEVTQEQEENTQQGRYLSFGVERETYGIEIEYVTEIIGMQQITQVPYMPHYIKGITNLRGKIIPVMDIGIRFEKKEKEYNDKTCIIIIDKEELTIGLIVDRVHEVVAIPQENIVKPPHENKKKDYLVKGIGKVGDSVKLLIDCNKLLEDEEVQNIQED